MCHVIDKYVVFGMILYKLVVKNSLDLNHHISNTENICYAEHIGNNFDVSYSHGRHSYGYSKAWLYWAIFCDEGIALFKILSWGSIRVLHAFPQTVAQYHICGNE